MKKWNEFTSDQKSTLANVMAAKCMTAAGVTDSTKSTAIATQIGYVIDSFADVRCIYDPGTSHEDQTFIDAVLGICYVGTPFIPSIVGIIRNTGTGANLVPEYGRKTESSSENKSGTEQVALKPTVPGTLPERIEIAIPDIRSATVGNVSATDVDSAEKMRFDAEADKSLSVLFGRWIRRASFTPDL